MSDARFVHLRMHTEFSLIDGIVRIKPLVKQAVEQGSVALGVTDHTNLYGLIKFYRACRGSGIKPILGCDFELNEPGNPSFSLFAMNEEGYQNIILLISKAFLEGQHLGRPYVEFDWVKEHSAGVIALSGAKFGDVGQALSNGKQQDALALAKRWQTLLGDRYYLELQRTGRESEDRYIEGAIAIADELQIPLVATNDVRFLKQEDFDAHEARVCIHQGMALDDPRREHRYSDQQYLRTQDEMLELFSDIPSAIENSVEIARRCTAEIRLGEYFLPPYPIPEGLTEAEFFRKISHDGLEWRLSLLFDKDAPNFADIRKEYVDRLEFELDIIIQMGFPGYFLIVMDFIQWAKDHDIPVGPGRGSGAGSLVAYALKITDLDPLEYDLLFERFLNPERVSMPDFDIDFCMDNRDQVINYVAENYGRMAVSQIITFGTMAAKAVVRDVARVQGKSYGLADKLSKLIPFEPGMTLEKAWEQEPMLPEFVKNDEEAQEIWEMAQQLEGVTRNVGKHAGGVVIAPNLLTDFSPLYCDETGEGLVTQYDKDDVEAAGLVKFDFLGLRTLTIIDWAKKMIDVQRAREGLEPLNIDTISLEDKKTFDLLQSAETTAVFQLESRGMKELIKRLLPSRFEDIVALVALFRPGPLQSGMVDDFIERKHGQQEVSYPHPQYQHELLKPVLEPTYGIILYQEQVMQIAQVMAAYSLGGADLLRRAMGKKKAEVMAEQRKIFMEGATKEGHSEELAGNIFDLMEKFAGYGFNKSHSAAYALVSYQTAWLKAHYPAPFMAAVMSSDMQNTDKVVTFIEECRDMGLTLLPPDVNQGELHFSVNLDNEIIYGLGAIKGLGEGPVSAIIDARKDGPFKDLYDFCSRIDNRKVNKRALEAMVRCGALDNLGPDCDLDKKRAVLLASMAEAVKTAEQMTANQNAGMTDLFGEVSVSHGHDDPFVDHLSEPPITYKERLSGEKDTLGLYLTGHPIDEYVDELKQFVPKRINQIVPQKHEQSIAGLIVDLRVMKNKRGDNMGFVTLDDRSGRIEVAVFADTFETYRDMLVKDTIVVVSGLVSHDDYSNQTKVRASSVDSIDGARSKRLQALRVNIDLDRPDAAQRLYQLVRPYLSEEGCELELAVRMASAEGVVACAATSKLLPKDVLLSEIREIFGNESVEMRF